MAKLSRIKGKVFERRIASDLREALPDLREFIHRSSQAHGDPTSPVPGARKSKTFDADVTGIPGLWIECQDARQPTPLAKLEQAERDVGTRAADSSRIPVAVTHRTGTAYTSTSVTMRLSSLIYFAGGSSRGCGREERKLVVTISWHDFLAMIARTQPWLL